MKYVTQSAETVFVFFEYPRSKAEDGLYSNCLRLSLHRLPLVTASTLLTGGLRLRLDLGHGLVDGPQGLVGVVLLCARAERVGEVVPARAESGRHLVPQHVQHHLHRNHGPVT